MRNHLSQARPVVLAEKKKAPPRRLNRLPNSRESGFIFRIVGSVLLMLSVLISFPSRSTAQRSKISAVQLPPTHPAGGRYITSSGNLNVLFVFVQFPDDNYLPASRYWPKGKAPLYMSATVDSVWSATPTQGGITDYFNQMSQGTFRITGKSVSVITPHSRYFYLDSGWTRADIQEEVLRKLDERVDFAEFDHWRFCSPSEYHHVNIPDGIVDMIFMVWRNVSNDTLDVRRQLDLVPGGEASLGYRSTKFSNSEFTVDGGKRMIGLGSGRWGASSGVTIIHPLGGDLSPGIIWQYARHEFGHWLLGGNEFHTKLGTWGLVDGWGTPGGCMNSFERSRLGWMNFIDIDDISTQRTMTNVRLYDYVTTGEALRIRVPGGSPNEYYLIENHQRISSFDVPDANVPDAKGIYVLHQESDEGDRVGIVSAEGRFDWSVVAQLPNIYAGSGNLPVFRRGKSDRVHGYSKRESVPWSWEGSPQKSTAIHYWYDWQTGELRKAPPTLFTGNGGDQFDPERNPVFTPTSNPGSDLYNNPDKIGFEVVGCDSGICTLTLYINTTDDAPPSNPQDLTVTRQTENSSATPVLNWSEPLEKHVRAGGFILIYQRTKTVTGGWSNWQKIDSVSATETRYPVGDLQPKGALKGEVQFEIRSMDAQGRLSAASEPALIDSSLAR